MLKKLSVYTSSISAGLNLKSDKTVNHSSKYNHVICCIFEVYIFTDQTNKFNWTTISLIKQLSSTNASCTNRLGEIEIKPECCGEGQSSVVQQYTNVVEQNEDVNSSLLLEWCDHTRQGVLTHERVYDNSE